MSDEELSTGSEASAGGDSETKGAEGTEQSGSQSQSPDGARVDSTSADASSSGQPKRTHPAWSDQRVIRKIVGEALGSHLREQLPSLLEEIRNQSQQPSAEQSQVPEQPDYNNLADWIKKQVASTIEQRVPRDLNQFKEKLTGDFKRTTAIQEARNYLISQKDIGRDKAKFEEIEQIMTDNLLDIAFEREPLRATQLAVDMWRKSKVNPNTPSKAQLSTVTGGTSVQPKKGIDMNEIKEMTDKLTGSLTIDEKEKLEARIDALMK